MHSLVSGARQIAVLFILLHGGFECHKAGLEIRRICNRYCDTKCVKHCVANRSGPGLARHSVINIRH